MLSLQPLFEIFCQTDDFFVQSDVFHSQLFQLLKQGKCLLLGQLPAMYGLYNLIVIYSDTAVFALKVCQTDIEVRCGFVDFHNFQRSAEYGGYDELGLGACTRI